MKRFRLSRVSCSQLAQCLLAKVKLTLIYFEEFMRANWQNCLSNVTTVSELNNVFNNENPLSLKSKKLELTLPFSVSFQLCQIVSCESLQLQ